MTAKKTQIMCTAGERISRRVFLGALGLGGLAMSADVGAGTRDSPSPAPCRYALIEHVHGRVHPLQLGVNTVGRDPDRDIRFEDMVISRKHCVVLAHPGGMFELRDTRSRNFTFVNGERVQQSVHLHLGDSIQICDRTLVLADLLAMPPMLGAGANPQAASGPVPGSLEWAEMHGFLDTAYEGA